MNDDPLNFSESGWWGRILSTMKALIPIVIGLLVVGCGKKPLTMEESKAAFEAEVIDAAIRKAAGKPTGELTEADLEKVTELDLINSQLSDVDGLEKLTQLKNLNLAGNLLTDVKSLEKLTQLKLLDLRANQLTDVKGLEKLTQLKLLILEDNHDLAKAQIDQLKKALPKCGILSNPKGRSGVHPEEEEKEE